MAGLMALFALAATCKAADFHVATAQDLQSALTMAAGNGAANNIWLTNGYYSGNFSYSSSANYNLAIQPEPGVSNTQVAIDGVAGGRALNITCSGSSGNVTVSNVTFMRNCGSYSIGALRVAASSGGTILVNACRFLSPTNNSQGMGLEIASGLNTTIVNCTVIGKTNGSAYDGDGINITGVTGTTLLYNSTMAGNYAGCGADITASAVLTVTNNVFQTNSNEGLYFYPSSGTKTAVVVVSNNVFSTTMNNNVCGAAIENFGTLNLGANIFNGNRGGGAYISYGGTATVAGNTFDGNDVWDGWWGGAAIGSLGAAIVTGNTFSGNTGGYGGGGVYLNNTTNILTGNTFGANSMCASGGAVTIVGGTITTISNNAFSANSASGSGGSVYSTAGGLVTITGNTFTGNSCSGNYQGGAVYVNSSGTNVITGDLFQQNSSADGAGAIYAASPGITISDNLVVNNTQTGSSAGGGGIFVNPGSILYMINNTVFNNSSAGNGGGAAFQISGTTQLLYVFNNIIWGNSLSGSGNGADVYLTGSGQQTALQYNDVNGMYGVWNIAAPMLNTDPKFFDPVNGDYHLQTNSPCLNYGTNGPFLLLTDLDGNARTNGAGQVDLGCYQFTTNVFHPADTNQDWTISPAEYTAYAAAWKAGQAWSNGPNPIPANYVTRAGYLMTNGGAYYNDGSARPVNWKLNP